MNDTFFRFFCTAISDPKYSRVPKNGVTAVEFYAGAIEAASENVPPGRRRMSDSSDPDVTSAPIEEILTRETMKTNENDPASRAFIIGARYNK